MKKLLGILVLGLLFISAPSKADDIREFEIEGMSIGDSLLDHEDEESIIKYSANIYDIDEYYVFANYFDHSSNYDGYQVHYKKNDKKYIIVALQGTKIFKNNIDECYDLRKTIVSEVKELFINAETQDGTGIHDGDPSGKSMVTYTRFYINKDSKFEDLQISCTDWIDGYKFSDGSNATDKLTVTITTDEYFEFLERAYE
jgi:hypothetical protein